MLSSWGSEDAKKNCCSWEGVQCNNQTGHVLELHLDFYGLRDIMTDKYSTWNGPEYSFYTDYGKYSDNSLNIIVGWKGNLAITTSLKEISRL
nr:hypothetical protein CFP56_47525 [Quercus suber]